VKKLALILKYADVPSLAYIPESNTYRMLFKVRGYEGPSTANEDKDLSVVFDRALKIIGASLSGEKRIEFNRLHQEADAIVWRGTVGNDTKVQLFRHGKDLKAEKWTSSSFNHWAQVSAGMWVDVDDTGLFAAILQAALLEHAR